VSGALSILLLIPFPQGGANGRAFATTRWQQTKASLSISLLLPLFASSSSFVLPVSFYAAPPLPPPKTNTTHGRRRPQRCAAVPTSRPHPAALHFLTTAAVCPRRRHCSSDILHHPVGGAVAAWPRRPQSAATAAPDQHLRPSANGTPQNQVTQIPNPNRRPPPPPAADHRPQPADAPVPPWLSSSYTLPPRNPKPNPTRNPKNPPTSSTVSGTTTKVP
jgi:hypothetical protein